MTGQPFQLFGQFQLQSGISFQNMRLVLEIAKKCLERGSLACTRRRPAMPLAAEPGQPGIKIGQLDGSQKCIVDGTDIDLVKLLIGCDQTALSPHESKKEHQIITVFADRQGRPLTDRLKIA